MGEWVAKAKKAKRTAKGVQRKEELKKPIPEEPPRIDWSAVPKLVTDPKLIAPPSLPMRHDHPYVPEEHVSHPEVRLVIKTRYMEQRPYVLAIESVIMATIIIAFFGVLLYLLYIKLAVLVPVLLAVWVLLVILLYTHFRD